jgi:tRNA-binding protein
MTGPPGDSIEPVAGRAPTRANDDHTFFQDTRWPVATFVPAPVKPIVAFSVLESLDIRIGTIEAVGDVPGSRKLIDLTVNFGDHSRHILAGMKQERSDLGALVGRQTLFVVNLEPRRMAGAISEGMLLDIGYADGLLPALAVPERPVPDGACAR